MDGATTLATVARSVTCTHDTTLGHGRMDNIMIFWGASIHLWPTTTVL